MTPWTSVQDFMEIESVFVEIFSNGAADNLLTAMQLAS